MVSGIEDMDNGVQGYGVQGMGYKGYGAQGQWGTWVMETGTMGYRGYGVQGIEDMGNGPHG